MFAYRLLRRILAFVTGVFFRQVEVSGDERIPADGETPVIFAGNHPNSLIDPVLIIVTCGRIVHFAAKDVLFRGAVMRWLLGKLGAVPVARKSDHEGGAVDNKGAFDRLAEVLAQGRAMGIFPEGVSHDLSQLQRLKTGAARIALDVAARGVPVKVVPCGLNYVRPKRFRSRVLVQYGTPIAITEAQLASWRSDEREAVRALTVEIEKAMRGLTVNASDWETVRALDQVRRLYQPGGITLEQRVELQRRFNEVYPTVKDHPDVAPLLARVRDYFERLRALGLTDRDLRRGLSAGELFLRAARQLVLGLFWLPLALPGIVLHAPLGFLISWAGRKFTPRKDVIATTKLILGLCMIPLAFGAILGVLWWKLGILVAALALLGLILSGIATVRVLERGARLGHLLAATVRALALRKEVASLARERAALEEEVVRAVDKFRPADMVPLFPRAPAGAAS
jgi:1-acyl-sn-glycerol-3-phosphate acyltransferase